MEGSSIMPTLVFLLITVATICQGQIIPKRPFGYVYNEGSNDALVLMAVHMGPLCPDSAAALPTLKQVADHYGRQKLKLTLHEFPLPYHHQAYLTAIGAQAVRMLGGPRSVFQWFDTIYANLEHMSNDATANLTQAGVINMLAVYAGQVGVDMMKFKQQMMSSDLENDVRAAWKYSCSRAIFGTPTFLLNDIKVDADPSWTLQDWMQVIDTLMPPIATHDNKTCPSDEPKCEYLPGKVECCLKGENCIPNVGCRCFGDNCFDIKMPGNKTCPSDEPKCEYLPGKVECCLKGENCIPNVGCRCFGENCLDNKMPENKTCPPDEPKCEYLPGKVECCLKGENCIPNVGCRCFGNNCNASKISVCTDGKTECEILPGKSECCRKKEACLPGKGCISVKELLQRMAKQGDNNL